MNKPRKSTKAHPLTVLAKAKPKEAIQVIKYAVNEAKGNKTLAAKYLNIPYRHLFRLIEKLGIVDVLKQVVLKHGYHPSVPAMKARGCKTKKKYTPPTSNYGRPRKQKVNTEDKALCYV